jgi:predicted DNA-binding transcriptional regulator YafY
MARSKSKRLVDLVTLLLQSHYPVSRERIRTLEGYPRGDEAFHRQFERDKASLRTMGFPLREVGDEEEPLYALDRRRLRLKDVQLTPEETVALALARRLAGPHALLGGNVRDALGKLGLVGGEVDPIPGVATLPPPRARSEEERLRLLESAVGRGHRLAVRYRRLGEEKPTARQVDPYGLYVYGGAWYLVGHDHLRDATRTFLVGRMAAVTRATRGSGPDFAPPKGFRIEEYVERMLTRGWSGIVADAVVRFPPGEVWRVGGLAGRRTAVKRMPDGGLEVRFKRANPDALVAWVSGLGGGVEVLAPPALRDEARARLERVAQVHAGRGKKG